MITGEIFTSTGLMITGMRLYIPSTSRLELNYKIMADTFERQIFDMNCSDCKHLQRSLSKRQEHVDLHYKMQKDLFDTKRIKVFKAAERRLFKGEKDKAKTLFKEARKMVFVFSESNCSLFYGKCLRKNKDVTFIPEIVMEENYQCFEHRIENTNN